MRITRTFLLFFSLFFFLSAQSQDNGVFKSIRYNNNVTYYPGATIGVQLEITGAFDIGNIFTLQMSDRNGDFTNPVTLATLNDFFTPIINGIIPSGTPVGTGYKLRVTSSGVNSTSITTTNSFTVETQIQAISSVNLSSPLSLTGSNLVKCFSTTIANPSFGYLNRNPGDKTTPLNLNIDNYNASETYSIQVYSENQVLLYTLNPTSGSFALRSGDPVGYYIVEITKTNQNRSTTTNFIYHFNTGNTSLGNVTNEVICVNDTVIFSVDANNMGKNYPGSKYQFVFGDDSPDKFFTHGVLMANPVVKHVFKEPTCISLKKKENNGAFYFKTDLKLLNKGLILSTQNVTNCNEYYINGFGTTKWTNASQPPKADFTAPEAICVNTPFTATNTSIPGSYGTALACLNNMISLWYIKSPNDQNFVLLTTLSGEGKLNLTLPASTFNVPGCWSIKLEVRNAEGCLNITEKIMNISVEEPPKPDFSILKDGAPVKEICINEIVVLQDKSNIASLQCQKPTYLWLITPSTGFTYIDNTNQGSANPRIQFTQPGIYKIIQQISNSCGVVQSIEQQIIVNGTPIVSFPSNNLSICKLQPADEIIDFSLAPNRPNYSAPPFAPTDYTWTVSGASADWEYLDGTNQKSQYPKIKFKAFRQYVIEVSVNGFCGSQNRATYTINLNQTPEITNAFTPIKLCSGQSFNSIDITTIIPVESIEWVGQINPLNSIQGATLTGNTSLIPGAVLTNTTSVSANLDYRVTVTSKGCTAEKSLNISVQPIPTAPQVTSPINYCLNASSQVLQATANTGNTLNWYSSVSGGISNTTAPIPTTSSLGSTTYYVSQSTATTPACEGPRSAIVVNVNEIPSITGVKTDPTNCTSPDGVITLNGLLPSVEYTLSYVYNGNTITSNITPDASGSYRIVQLSGGSYSNLSVTRNNCKSNELIFELTNPQVPQNLTTQPVSPICAGGSITLSASSSSTGAIFEWSGPGISGIASGPSITITNALSTFSGNYTLVANILGCKSSPIIVPVVVHQTPTAPVVTSPVNYCKDASSVVLGAGVTTSTNSLLWYRDQVGGEVLTSAPVPSTATIGAVTYYVSQLTATTPSCEGPRSAIVVNVYEVPSITGEKTNPTNCINPDGTIKLSGLQSGVLYTLNYSYNGVAVGARSLTSSGGGVIVMDLLPEGRYDDIRVTLNGCTSNPLSFVLENPLSPQDVKVSSNAPLCSGGVLELRASSSTVGSTFTWSGPAFSSSVEGALQTLSSSTVAMSGTYNVIASIAGCKSAGVTTSVVVHQTPTAPVVTSPVNYCKDASSVVLGAGVTTSTNSLLWYRDQVGGEVLTSAPVPSTATIGAVTYYVSQLTATTPSCEGPRSAIVVNVYEVPSITGEKTNPTNCINPDGTIKLSGLQSGVLYTLNYSYNGVAVGARSLTSSGGGVIVMDLLPEGRYDDIRVTLNGCTSNPLSFVLENPLSPQDVKVSSNAPLCSGGVLELRASSSTVGSTFTWSGPAFSSSVEGALQTLSSSTVAMSGTYNVIASIAGCKSAGVTTSVVVHQTPTAPVVTSPVNYCKDASSVVLGAGVTTSTNSLLWYRDQVGGEVLTSAPVPSTATIGAVTYYVSQLTATTPSCEGPRSAIVVNVYEVPSITGEKTNPTNCINPDGTIKLSGLQSGVLYTLNYSYNGVAVGARSLTSSGGGVIVMDLLPEGRYDDIRVTLNGCTSNPLSFVLENPLSPQDVKVSSNAPLCSGGVLELRASSSTVGSTFTWSGPAFSSSVEGALQTLSSSTVAMSGTYNVIASIVGCKAPAVSINITIYQTPAAPKVTTPIDYCLGDQTSPVIAEPNPGNSLLWYTQDVGGTGNPFAPLPSSSKVGSTIYYVSQLTPTSPVCEGERAKIEVIINPIPSIQASALPPVKCNTSDGVITLDGLFKNTRYKVFYKINGVSISTEYAANDEGKIIIKNLPAAVYSNVYVSLKGCVSNEIGPFTLIHPDVPSTPVAKSNSAICEGTQLELSSFSITPNVTYEWVGPNNFRSSVQNPSINFATPLSTGRYSVVSKGNGCISDTGYVDVVVNPKPIVNLGPDLEIPPGIKKTLSNSIQFGPIEEYKWTPSTNLSCDNCPIPIADIKKNITYNLKVRNVNGCIGEDTINIKTLCEQKQIFIPNAFTPESGTDPLNKSFFVSSVGLVTIKSIRVFTRWGELVFEKFNISTNDPSSGWNGQIRGVTSKTDVFVYAIEVVCENGAIFSFKGNVTLLR